MSEVLEVFRTIGPFAPLLVFVAAAAESAGFVGLFVPGEMMTIVGGAVAGFNNTPLLLVVAAAVLGAFVGDSIGYWIGHRFGARLLEHRFLQRARTPFRNAGEYLDERGSIAFIVSRFMPVIRSFVPMAAGAGRVSYRRFVVPNAVGCLAWGSAVASLGYWAGTRWETIQRIVGRGMALFAAIIVTGVAMRFAYRWIQHHPTLVRHRLSDLARRRVLGAPVRLFVSTWGHPRPFVRALPFLAFAAFWTVAIFITALFDVSRPEARFIEWLATQVDPTLQNALQDVGAITETTWLIAVALLAVAATLAVDRRRALTMAACVAAAGVVSVAAGIVADRAVGPIPMSWAIHGDTYPDPASAVLSALIFSFAWPWNAKWTRGIRQFGLAVANVVALMMVMILGALRYPIDVVAGVAIGASVVVLIGLMLDPNLRHALRTEPYPEPATTTIPPAVPAAPIEPI